MAPTWVKVENPDGKPYYWNTETNETSWHAPRRRKNSKGFLRPKKAALAKEETTAIDCTASDDAWQEVVGSDGKTYWWNIRTNETRWQLPGPPEDVVSEEKVSSEKSHFPNFFTRSRRSSAAPKLTSATEEAIDVKPRHSRSSSSVPPITGTEELLPLPQSLSASKVKKGKLFGSNKGENKSKGTDDWSQMLKQLWKEKSSGKPLKELLDEVKIGDPYDVEHIAHVSFDAKEVKYNGLPQHWDSAQNQFGVCLSACPRIEVPGYKSRVPAVLVFLRKALEELNGFESEGIFRIAPNGNECNEVKEKLNKGLGSKALEECKDPHVAANLIKQFYRELNPNLLNALSRDKIMEMADYSEDSEFEQGIQLLEEPNNTAFLWLLDLMSDVAKHESINRMSAKNLAIVISPNLFSSDNLAPMEALVLSQKTANVVTNFLQWKIRTRDSEQ